MEINSNVNRNIYKYFRGTVDELDNELLFTKKFDEPTYLSFRLMFGSDDIHNTTGFSVSNDKMPHPLFSYDNNPSSTQDIEQYSAIRYLKDANEPVRAKMMFDFVKGWSELQDYNAFYFQSIEGIGELLKVDPTKGQRILNDTKLKIKCLEGLDQRMTYLMNLYRKAVWDDVYQRWILPDMMRYFNLSIYLTEFRTFHRSQFATENRTEQLPQTAYGGPMNLYVLNGILPMWHIKCEMCEFDITDIEYEHLSGLNIGEDPVQGAISFGVKVGNIKEVEMFPVFKYLLDDNKLGGLGRLSEEVNPMEPDLNETANSEAEVYIAQNVPFVGSMHESGKPYNENKNKNTIKDAKYPLQDTGDFSKATNMQGKGEINEPTIFYDDKSGQLTDLPIDSTLPNTWVGNALDFGTNYAINFVDKWVDKAKMTAIPGLGISFTEIKSALQGKDVVTAFGLIRKAVAITANEFILPSQRLNGEIESTELTSTPSQELNTKLVDNVMATLISEITKSDATDDDSLELKSAANLILSNKGLWEEIKDYSLATNLVGPEELNTQVIVTEEGYKKVQDGESDRLSNTTETGMTQDEKASENLSNNAVGGGTTNKVQPSVGLSGNIDSNLKLTEELSEATNNIDDLQLTKGIANPEVSKATKTKLEVENTITTIEVDKEIKIGEIFEAPPSGVKSVIEDTGLESGELFKANEGKLTPDHFESNEQLKSEEIVESIKNVDPFKATEGEIKDKTLQDSEISKATNSKINPSLE